MAGGNLFKGLYSSDSLSRPQRLARAAAVGVVVCGGAYAVNRRCRPESVRPKQSEKRFLLPQPVVDAICGAVGEVSQIVLLYPLETIKVRCQADCLSATAVVQNMTRNGWGPHVVQQLYAGLGSAAAFSVVVGAIHWLTFCTAKRAALDVMEEAPEGADVGMLASANMVGATVGAIMTALVEGPLELFRHQAQAGLISGNLFREMNNVVKKQGPMGLYWGFLPYCLESFPYDISELATYSQLRDVYNQAVTQANALTGGKASALFGPEAKVPSQVRQLQLWDIAIGAAAGSAATLISMPFDVVKTYMQVRAFFATGSRMVAQHGAGALWVGVVPRLAQQVPSCTICWHAHSNYVRAYVVRRNTQQSHTNA
eukprot:XP_001690711.1 predicted protein [Chlamydomonas reinhardtii]